MYTSFGPKSMQPVHPQININVCQAKRDWVSGEYSSSNINRDMLVKDETLNYLLDFIH